MNMNIARQIVAAAPDAIRPFRIAVPEAALADLRRRLANYHCGEQP